MTEAPSSSGTIYTFYSYKGGVGRSMALVNIGVLLALAGKRVLLIDWDLEAPGLEVFFRKSTELVGDPASVPGVVDLLEAHSSGRKLPWTTCLLRAKFLGKSLDFISAGSRTPDYRKRVQQLDWDTLYKEHKIGNFINELRKEWRREYEFVLVDSRTGITDIGDICTVLLPDAIVLMFVTNHQNVEGIKNVMARAVKARNRLPDDRAKLHGIPLPARDEVYNEYEKSLEWKRIFADEFGFLYREWLPKEVRPEDALNKLFVPYVTNWSFGECIPVLENASETKNPTSIGSAYQRVANLLANGLDWYSLEGKVTVGELQGAQVDLLRERERANELEEHVIKVSRAGRLYRWVAIASLLLVALLIAWWGLHRRATAVPPQSTELIDGVHLFSENKTVAALKVFQARAALLNDRLKTSPGDPLILSDVGTTNMWLGDALDTLGRSAEALAVYQTGLAAREQLVKKAPDDRLTSRGLAVNRGRIGEVLLEQGKLDEALIAFRSSEAILDTLTSQDPSNKNWQLDLAVSHNQIGRVLEEQGKLDEALASFRSDMAIMDKLQDPSNTHWQRELAASHSRIGIILQDQGKLEEALAWFRVGKGIMDKLTSQDPSNTDWQYVLAVLHRRIGVLLELQGKLDDALAAFRSSEAIMLKLTGQDPSNIGWQRDLGVTHHRIGRILQKQGKLVEALASFRSGMAIMDKLTRQDPSNPRWQVDLAHSRLHTGLTFRDQANVGEAQQELTGAVTILTKLRAIYPRNADWQRLLIEVYREASATELRAGDTTAALTSIEQADAVYRTVKIEKGADNFWQPEHARVFMQRGEILNKIDESDNAKKQFGEARTILVRLLKVAPGNADWKRDMARLNSLEKPVTTLPK